MQVIGQQTLRRWLPVNNSITNSISPNITDSVEPKTTIAIVWQSSMHRTDSSEWMGLLQARYEYASAAGSMQYYNHLHVLRNELSTTEPHTVTLNIRQAVYMQRGSLKGQVKITASQCRINILIFTHITDGLFKVNRTALIYNITWWTWSTSETRGKMSWRSNPGRLYTVHYHYQNKLTRSGAQWKRSVI